MFYSDFKRLPFLSKAFAFLLTISYICSMYPWFIWGNYFATYTIVGMALIAILSGISTNTFNKKLPIVFIISLAIMILWQNRNSNVFGFLVSLCLFVSSATLISNEDEFKKTTLSLITGTLATIIAISLIAYFLNLADLLHIKPKLITYDGVRYFNFNYYFFILPQAEYEGEFLRFKSIFLEPGHMAMGTTILIIANKFNLKNPFVFILFLGNLISFSLASYLIMLFSWATLNFSIKKIHFLFLGILFIFAANFIMIQSGNENIIDRFIWERLEYSETKGIEGNNRTTYYYDAIYKTTISHFDTMLLGYGATIEDSSGGNAGYKRYIVENGLLGVIFVISFYFFAFFLQRKKDLFILSSSIMLLLLQDFYPTWSCVLISYILGSSVLGNEPPPKNYSTEFFIN